MKDAALTRFMAKVDKTNSCWLWTGARMRKYGKFKIASYKLVPAHRASYEHFIGPIPDGYEVDHLCYTPLCVNPGHLEAVTSAENKRRAAARKTHCKHGHEFTPENTYRGVSGHRSCRACHRTNEARRTAADPERVRAQNKAAQERQRSKKRAERTAA